jgi:hypothetical protein
MSELTPMKNRLKGPESSLYSNGKLWSHRGAERVEEEVFTTVGDLKKFSIQ